jgi:hypothetical protein
MYIVFPYELSLRDYYISFHLKEFHQKSLSKVFCTLPKVPCKGGRAVAAWRPSTGGGQQPLGALVRVSVPASGTAAWRGRAQTKKN